MTSFDIEGNVEAVTDIVRTASRRSLEWYRRPMTIENKSASASGTGASAAASEAGGTSPSTISAFDPVTAADRAVEDEIRAGLGRLFPDHAIVGEERADTGTGPIRWIIDPIDGTRAFITGQPMWGTLLGVQIEGRAIAGWMHQPVLDETHVATPSGGWVQRGADAAPLAVSATTNLGDSVLLCTHPEMFDAGHQADAFRELTGKVRMTRYSGDCVNYGLLAVGLADLVVENQLAPHDIIPLIPIVEAAGGVITDLAGRAPVEGGFVVAAATRELHEAAMAQFAGLVTADPQS